MATKPTLQLPDLPADWYQDAIGGLRLEELRSKGRESSMGYPRRGNGPSRIVA